MDTIPSVLRRGVSEIFPNNSESIDSQENFAQRLMQATQPLRIKFGIDPTGAQIHLGHSIPIRKLRAFQDVGHTAVLIIGDFTARIGDPTGKSEVRRQLTDEEVAANARTYLEQLQPILDFATPGRLEVHYNSEWLAQLDLSKISELLATMTVGQMLAKEGFAERYEKGEPVYLHEFLYPLMQGYDSVAVQADVELGATDQKFNIAVGRDLQRYFQQSPQFGLLVPILLGTDGVQKMSKSLNNYVGLAEDPLTMYSKLEKTPDSVLMQYFELLTDLPLDQLPVAPRDRQKLLAFEVVRQYYGEAAAQQAKETAIALVMGGGNVTAGNATVSAQGVVMAASAVTAGNATVSAQGVVMAKFSLSQVQFPAKLFYLISASGLCQSSSEARRQIQGGAVKLDGQRVDQVDLSFESIAELEGKVLQVGKKKFVRFVASA